MRSAFTTILVFLAVSASAQEPVDSEEFIAIGGIKQYITLKGKDESKPLLLFLHGGPGGSMMSYAHTFTGELQKHFVVVQWDQRDAGKTLEQNASPVPLTLDLFENDTRELIDSLLNRFHQKKIYLIGHSWGTVLGFRVAGKYPELLHALVAIGAVVNQLESERIILDLMKEYAVKNDNTTAAKQLTTVEVPFQNSDQLYYHRKWLFHFNGQNSAFDKISKSYIATWSSRWLAVWNEASAINLMESLPEVGCPVYFFAGRKDYQTNSGIAETYFKKLKAPKKGFYWFERSRHGIPTTEPQRLQQIIIEKILPET